MTQYSIDHSAEAAFWVTLDGQILYANNMACRRLGYSRKELLALSIPYIDSECPAEGWTPRTDQLVRARSSTFESHHRRKNGEIFPVIVTADYFKFEGRDYIFAFVTDASERKRSEQEKEKLQAQLRQAQKMEAIGQLAGGVAHDFNNILTAILGNVELTADTLKAQRPAEDPVMLGLQQIEQGAHRAAGLTRQLLAFSRRQVVQPQALNLNTTVSELEKMLGRLLTENIKLALDLAPDLKPIR
ncbi:MAG: PAS domain S-box protein, partial [bacterium]|nr:PAS domain S-box protein [bacterium]